MDKKYTHNQFRSPGLGVYMLFALLLLFIPSQGQNYTIGQSYFGKDQYIEYQAGNLPVILSAPHGGHLEPGQLPNRNCEDCAYVKDSYTQELTRAISASFFKQTGCYPHVVYNLLHRKKLDMNRGIETATDSNAVLYPYWYDYHNFITAAKQDIVSRYGRGLFLDMHGHGHLKQRIEYGYLLYGSELRMSDEELNDADIIEVSSIENLVRDNNSSSTHAELIRGKEALGTQLALKGYPGVPSQQDPFPLEGDLYFNGGYNTYHHGSSPGGTIDAIQLELYTAIRFDSLKREAFADSLVTAVLRFLHQHYYDENISDLCMPPLGGFEEEDATSFSLTPNPVTENVRISSTHPDFSKDLTLRLYDATGRICIQHYKVSLPYLLWVGELPSGFYRLSMVTHEGQKSPDQKLILIR